MAPLEQDCLQHYVEEPKTVLILLQHAFSGSSASIWSSEALCTTVKSVANSRIMQKLSKRHVDHYRATSLHLATYARKSKILLDWPKTAKDAAKQNKKTEASAKLDGRHCAWPLEIAYAAQRKLE